MLACVISVGVQTWGTNVVALRRYWQMADDLGYARITYCFDPSSHHPSWLAKRVVAADHLSRGRLDLRLAVGAEDSRAAATWRSHAIPYPDAPTRIALAAETTEILEKLWTGELVDHVGRFYTLRGAQLAPCPIQKPGPPVWLAAMGQGALRVAAQRAAGWEASYLTPAAFGERWSGLRTLLEREGRPSWEYRRSVELDVVLGLTDAEVEDELRRFCAARAIERRDALLEAALVGTADTVAARIAQYAAAGATDLMLGFADFPAIRMVEIFAERVRPSG